MHDRTIPTNIKMQTVRNPDRYTLLTIHKIAFDLKIPEKIFSLQNLYRR